MASIDAGFIALLKVAVTIVLGQAPTAPLGGATEITAGAVRPGFVPDLSGSPHPATTMSSRNAANQILWLFSLRISTAFYSYGFGDIIVENRRWSSLLTIAHIDRAVGGAFRIGKTRTARAFVSGSDMSHSAQYC